MKMKLVWNESEQKIVAEITESSQVGSFYSEEVARSIAKYIPKQTGMLASNYDTEPKKIIYTQPYAHYIYTGVNLNFSKEMNPNASTYWERRLTKSEKAKIARAVTKMLGRKG